MTELATRPVDELSGGQRQRAWIAMALAQDTPTLLLDEPTTFLDLAHQCEVMDLLERLNREDGRTIVAVLHDLNQAARYADHMIAMRDGAGGRHRHAGRGGHPGAGRAGLRPAGAGAPRSDHRHADGHPGAAGPAMLTVDARRRRRRRRRRAEPSRPPRRAACAIGLAGCTVCPARRLPPVAGHRLEVDPARATCGGRSPTYDGSSNAPHRPLAARAAHAASG